MMRLKIRDPYIVNTYDETQNLDTHKPKTSTLV